MSDRADGFWWVRIDAGSRWYVGEVHGNELTIDRLDPDSACCDAWELEPGPDDWGPYLGTAPPSADAQHRMTPMTPDDPHVTESFAGQRARLEEDLAKLRQALLGSHVARLARRLRRMVQR